jgi:hypothetical protein
MNAAGRHQAQSIGLTTCAQDSASFDPCRAHHRSLRAGRQIGQRSEANPAPVDAMVSDETTRHVHDLDLCVPKTQIRTYW